jgi:hypothetical protein
MLKSWLLWFLSFQPLEMADTGAAVPSTSISFEVTEDSGPGLSIVVSVQRKSSKVDRSILERDLGIPTSARPFRIKTPFAILACMGV